MSTTKDGSGVEASVETRTVRAGESELFVAEAGTGDPVVLLHGGGPGATGLSNFSRNIDALATRYRVIVPDMPGYGRSSKRVGRDDPFGFLADALRSLLDTLGVERAHLVGNSYGGAAALRLALDTPERADRLVLMGPGGVGTTRRPPTKGLNALLGYYGGDGPSREKLEAFIREYLVFDGQAVPDELVDLRYEASLDPEVVKRPPLRRPSGLFALRTLWRMDFTRDKRLRELQTPTLVVWGTEDKVNRPSGGAELVGRMPNAKLLEVPLAGHWVQWERAGLFNDAVLRFLGDA
jgi:2-hydroxy-6-oxonona-2,4-dienedioate hydrolase/4,5:9,10-diseco-3-hydroxy-5,9,17-trioxoandrosta-1(10),2-diene-4-oate hydrolase